MNYDTCTTHNNETIHRLVDSDRMSEKSQFSLQPIHIVFFRLFSQIIPMYLFDIG